MLKHMRILAVAFLAAMIFAGCGESKSSSGKSSDKSSSSSSGKKTKKTTRKLDSKKLAEGKKAIEEDKKRGIEFEENKNGIVLIKFSKDSNIKSYEIPYGVTVIGVNAFSGRNLTSVTIPDSVTEIEAWAFFWCDNLTSVTIPDSVTEIGSSAFGRCKNLTSVTIPDSIESMPYNAFDNIKNVIAAQKNPNFYFDDRGVLFNKKTKALLGAPEDLNGSYVIPTSVTKIGCLAFVDCKKLTSVTIPDSVTKIGFSAFASCDNLTNVTIPTSVTEIGFNAFGYCKKLASITIPTSVTEIGDDAFSDCDNLASITLPAKFKGKEKDLKIPENCKVTYR